MNLKALLMMILLVPSLHAAADAPAKPELQDAAAIGLRAFTIITPVSHGKQMKWQEKLYLVNEGSSSRFLSGASFQLSGNEKSGEQILRGGGMGNGASSASKVEQLKKLEAKSIWCTGTLDWEARPQVDGKRDSMNAGVLDGEKLAIYSVPLTGRYFQEKGE